MDTGVELVLSEAQGGGITFTILSYTVTTGVKVLLRETQVGVSPGVIFTVFF